jgi:hypothetical protein
MVIVIALLASMLVPSQTGYLRMSLPSTMVADSSVNLNWDEAAKRLYQMKPEGCDTLTATVEVDDGYVETGFFCTSDGKQERIPMDPRDTSDLGSMLLRIRHDLFQETGGKINGCEIIVNSDRTFKYRLFYPN